MKEIKFARLFELHYKARIAKDENLRRAYQESVETFQHDRAAVGDHELTGEMAQLNAFWITEDYRVVYRETLDSIVFIDVGTHDEVYYE